MQVKLWFLMSAFLAEHALYLYQITEKYLKMFQSY